MWIFYYNINRPSRVHRTIDHYFGKPGHYCRGIKRPRLQQDPWTLVSHRWINSEKKINPETGLPWNSAPNPNHSDHSDHSDVAVRSLQLVQSQLPPQRYKSAEKYRSTILLGFYSFIFSDVVINLELSWNKGNPSHHPFIDGFSINLTNHLEDPLLMETLICNIHST